LLQFFQAAFEAHAAFHVLLGRTGTRCGNFGHNGIVQKSFVQRSVLIGFPSKFVGLFFHLLFRGKDMNGVVFKVKADTSGL
jgi:hypothetical protein